MANNNSDKKVTDSNNNSGLPLIIIGVVLLAAVIGGWYLYSSSSKKTIVSSNTNTAANRTTPQANNAPVVSNVPGAQPPHFKGAQNASVVVEEFADYQCPTCASMHPVMNEITAMYGSRIKFIYRNYPLTQIHKNAYDAATSAEAAGLQGKFWEMQNLLFQNQRAWSNAADAKPTFEGYAQTIGLDVQKFKADVAGMAAKQRVDLDLKRAQSMNISSTPSVFINGTSVPFEQMTVDGMKKVIDAELAKSPASQPPTTSSQTTTSQSPATNQPKVPAANAAGEQGAGKSAANSNLKQ